MVIRCGRDRGKGMAKAEDEEEARADSAGGISN